MKLKKSTLLVLLCFAGQLFGWENEVTPWKKLEKCQIVESYGNDGDSFHVKHNGKEYVFRLCFADCPESSDSYPQRVHEQAEWWGISDEDVVRAGHDATKFTMKLLKDRKFTVYTKFKDARGNSKLGREFAMIKIDGKWLSERLVENGLARSYGYALATPDGISRRDYRHRLDELEKAAKKSGAGAWGYRDKKAVDKSDKVTEKSGGSESGTKLTLKVDTALYSDDPFGSFRGTLKAGTVIYIQPKGGDRFMEKVKAPLHGKMVYGKCRRYDIEKQVKTQKQPEKK
jgi:endonuclease YncB( thermonuclease family)